MARFSPHAANYKTIGRLRNILKIIFWSILLLSVIPVYIKNSKNICNYLSIIAIILFFALDIIIDYVVVPYAERKRRDDFIDNSFGARNSIQQSDGYFDNDDINTGFYKAAVNLFENSFFTSSLLNRILIRKLILLLVVFLVFITLCFYGLRDNDIALIALQAIFSASIVGDFIKYLILRFKVEQIFTQWKKIFDQTGDLAQSPEKHIPLICQLWLEYESTISRILVEIPQKVFDENNTTLTTNWNKIRSLYSIS
ncbi:hypothetical protein QEG73_14960 [Chitinophagaceae bacterium 26-R-25]|nr:hypothetical protein [Chitinophagaceae bacterium 26-R-25]